MNRAAPLWIVAAAGIGFAAGWWLRPASGPADASETRMRDLETQVARLSEDLKAARAAGPSLAGRTPSAPVPGSPGATTTPDASSAAGDAAAAMAGGDAAKPAKGPRFLVPGFEEGLKEVEWDVIGSNLREMAPAISKFAEDWASTGALPADLVGRIQQLNGPLVTAALKVGAKFDIKNPNAAFTHPAFMVNAIAAALSAANLPLSEEQARLLQKVGEDYTARERTRTTTYDDRAFALQKALDESALRDEFFAAAFALLTPEQRDALQPPATKGRLQADLFSSGLVWLTRAQILPFSTREGLVADMKQRFAGNMPLPAGSDAALADALAEWAAAFPPEVVDTPVDAMTLNGMVSVARVTDAARRQMALFQRLMDLGRFDETTNRRIRAVGFVVVPVRTK